MNAFVYFQPTEIRFGCGSFAEVGESVGRYGTRCIVVTGPKGGHVAPLLEPLAAHLGKCGIEMCHYDGVVPNPTTDCITAGAAMAKEFRADVVLGLGGGSSMDAAKAIAVEAVHEGTCWDYLFFKQPPSAQTLPVVAVSTTSGTGSQVTQVSVVTHTLTKTKSALYNAILYPRVALVDPDLVVSAPPHVTAASGFDAFTHAFESYLHVNASPYTDLLALEAIRLIAAYLPRAVEDGTDMEARASMGWADTLAGLCIAAAGVTLPHGIGMTIGGQCPQVMHGEALAVVYPEFTRFTYPCAVQRFATVGRIFNRTLADATDDEAAAACCDEIDLFLQRIGMWLSLQRLGATEQDVAAIADRSQELPDYKNNPRIATRDEIYGILTRSYTRV